MDLAVHLRNLAPRTPTQGPVQDPPETPGRDHRSAPSDESSRSLTVARPQQEHHQGEGPQAGRPWWGGPLRLERLSQLSADSDADRPSYPHTKGKPAA